MDIELKDATWIMRIVSFAGGAIATGSIALYKIRDHGKRITVLESGKVGKIECGTIQTKNAEKFSDGSEEFKEVKQLIEKSNELHQRRHDDLVKIMLENLRQ